MNGTSAALSNSECLNSFNNVFSYNHRSKNHHGIIICGHRGGFKSTNSPENTIQAFSKAIEIGLQAIELDVSNKINIP